jgi:hypothetical protein
MMPEQQEEEPTNELGAMSTEAGRNPVLILAGENEATI